MRILSGWPALCLVGCGGGPVDPAPIPPPGFGPVLLAVIEPGSATIAPGDTVRFRIVSVGGSVPERSIWSASDTTFAVVDSLGLVTSRRVGDVAIRGTGIRGTMVGTGAVVVTIR